MIPEVIPFDEGRRATTVAFSTWYEAEYPSVVRLARSLTLDWDRAEEIAQDAFVAALRRWDRISTYDDPSAWVRRVAINAALSRLRRASNEIRGLARLARRSPDRRDDTPDDPDDAVWDAVRRLPRRQAEAIALVIVEDRSVRDVAAILGCEERTVRTHLARGRSALAARLTQPVAEHSEVDDGAR